MGLNFGGAASGAITGASIGSAIPGVGTAIGAIGGGILGLFGKKKKKKAKPVSTLDPQQQALYKQQIDALQGVGPFADLYNFDANAANENFENMYSRPAYRNFSENIIPSITGQFRQGNLMSSSYSGGALAKAGRDVQEGLDAQRANMIYQGQQDAMSRKQSAIDRILGMQTFAYSKPQEGKGNAIDQILSAAAPAAGSWFADFLKPKV